MRYGFLGATILSFLLGGTLNAESSRRAPYTGPFYSSPGFWRSATLPGWGQYHQGRYDAAAIFASTVFLPVGVAIMNFRPAGGNELQASRFYYVAGFLGQNNGAILRGYIEGVKSDTARQKAAQEVNAALYVAGFFYVMNVLDAYLYDTSPSPLAQREQRLSRWFWGPGVRPVAGTRIHSSHGRIQQEEYLHAGYRSTF